LEVRRLRFAFILVFISFDCLLFVIVYVILVVFIVLRLLFVVFFAFPSTFLHLLVLRVAA
jgi:hypothetical protein